MLNVRRLIRQDHEIRHTRPMTWSVILYSSSTVFSDMVYPTDLGLGIWEGIQCAYMYWELTNGQHYKVIYLWDIGMSFWMPSQLLVVVPLELLCLSSRCWWWRPIIWLSMFTIGATCIWWRWWLWGIMTMWLTGLWWVWWWGCWIVKGWWWCWWWSCLHGVSSVNFNGSVEYLVNIG